MNQILVCSVSKCSLASVYVNVLFDMWAYCNIIFTINGVLMTVLAGGDPCSKDPCTNLARAILGTCRPLGSADFICSCQHSSSWDDETNSCVGKSLSIWGKYHF